MQVFHETGVRAVVATNTLPSPVPDDTETLAGIGGGRLHSHAVQAVQILSQEKSKHGYAVDIIGCGGIQDRKTYRSFTQYGVVAVQYWSGLAYRGPLVAAYLS
jgi:dihydroorotate dehydrogenase